jgi:hypothetical protein
VLIAPPDDELLKRSAHAEMHMFASMPHAFDFDPRIAATCVEILGMFYDRIFRPEVGPNHGPRTFRPLIEIRSQNTQWVA